MTPKNKANLDPAKVSHHIHRVGNHFPADVVAEACAFLGYHHRDGKFYKTNGMMQRSLAAHQNKERKEQIKSSIEELFPGIPAADLKEIANHAWKKANILRP
jgi:hypothetical protein